MKKWYYAAVFAGIVITVAEPILFNKGMSMVYAGIAFIALGLGGIVGSRDPLANEKPIRDFYHNADKETTDNVINEYESNLPVWRNYLANVLLLIGMFLFVMSLFA